MSVKTYKREVAGALLAALGLLTALWVGWGNEIAGQAVDVLVAPVMGFAAMAFGGDALSKHLKGPMGGPRE
jgi:hypothetical protein